MRECGTRLTSTSNRQCGDIRTFQMPGMPQLPSTIQETRYGCPPGICVSICPVEKLSAHYIGPFTIQRKINEVTYQLQLPPRYRIHPTFHVSLLKPFSLSTPEPHEPDEPLPPEILDQPSVYQVIDIMDSWRRGSRLEYLVDWERTSLGGYILDILDSMLLEEFLRLHRDCPAPEAMVVHVAVRGCPEPPLEEGVVSVIHLSHQSPDHNHLSSDSPHLSAAIKKPFKSTLHPVTHCPVYCSLP